MLTRLRKTLLFVAFTLLCSTAAWSQVTTLEGDIKDENGQGVKGALVKLVRTDIKGNYKVKSDKKGHWFYTGLPLGTYDITVEVEGKDVDGMKGVKSKYGDSTIVDFDLKKRQQEAQAAQQAAETGQLTQEQARGLSKEDKEKIEKQMKERTEAMKKNTELNNAFTAGQTALQAKDYPTAIDQFTKASQMDPKQVAVWGNLADAEKALALTKTGPEQQAGLEKSIVAYQKAIELQPNDASLHNNLAITYGSARKIDEAKAEIMKAVQLDPTSAGKSYYNIGAMLVNSGQADQAADMFQKAIAADPNYADAHYQYGIVLIGKAQVDKNGKVTPPAGTAEHFQKYLELKPDGPFAQSSKEMLASIEGAVQTEYTAPGATKKGKKK